ncbi:unnamed protein product [Polarella glacialis]|uniref:Uncharacterized protein n=2 Tax=Polarella glacialis TaxID=89957 RepID=A0A813HCW4_POLGL|nr:unnamed protein product [Polarella glacialis]
MRNDSSRQSPPALRRGRKALGLAAAAAAAGLILCVAPGWTLAAASNAPLGVGRVEIPAEQASALAGVWRQVDVLDDLVARKGVVPHFGTLAAAVVKRGVAASGAGGAEAEGLEQAIDAPLRMLFQQQLQTLLVRAADRYDEEMTARPNPMEARRAAEEMFLRGARDLVRPFSDWRYEAEHQDLLSRLLQSFGQDLQLVTEQGKQGQGKHVTIEVIRKLQEQGAGVQREAETRGAFPWNVKWQYMVENSPLGFRGQYNQGRSVVELLLMPSPDPRLKKNLLNRLGPLNLAVAFDMLL